MVESKIAEELVSQDKKTFKVGDKIFQEVCHFEEELTN
jgi:hypothetical protein